MWGFRVEPTGVAELVRQVMFMLIIFGVIHWTDVQQGAVLSVVSAILSLITRASTASEHTLRQAGTSSEEVKKIAVNPVVELRPTMIGPDA